MSILDFCFGVIIGVITAIVLLVLFVLIFGNVPKNVGMSTEELIYGLEKIGYTFTYEDVSENVLGYDIVYTGEELTNGTYSVSKRVDADGYSTVFHNKSLNNEFYFFDI